MEDGRERFHKSDVDIRYCSENAKIDQRRDSVFGNPAGNDSGIVLKVWLDVDRDTVESDPVAHAYSHCGDF